MKEPAAPPPAEACTELGANLPGRPRRLRSIWRWLLQKSRGTILLAAVVITLAHCFAKN